MTTTDSSAFRSRFTAAAIAFAVVAGGSSFVALPAAAATVEPDSTTPVATSEAPEATDAVDASEPTATSAGDDAATDDTQIDDAEATTTATTDATATETPVEVASTQTLTVSQSRVESREFLNGGIVFTGTGFVPGASVEFSSDRGFSTTLTADADGVVTYTTEATGGMEGPEAGIVTFTMFDAANEARATVELEIYFDAEAVVVTTPKPTLGIVEAARDGYAVTGSGFAPGVPTTATLETSLGETLTLNLEADENGIVTLEVAGGPDVEPYPVGTIRYTLTQEVSADDVRSGSVTITFVDDTADDDEVAPQLALLLGKAEFAPGETVPYSATGFRPGVELVFALSGPVGGDFTGTTDETGTLHGELEYFQYDRATGAHLGRVDWPLGTYTLTVTDPATGESVSATFKVVGSSAPGDSPRRGGGGTTVDRGDDYLATTGATELFGAAGIGLLLATAGVGLVSLRRRRASDEA